MRQRVPEAPAPMAPTMPMYCAAEDYELGGGFTATHMAASADPVVPDVYAPIGVIPHNWQIGGYALPARYRRHVNDPGLLRRDFVGQLLSRWNAPPTIWWARNQGKANVNIGGAAYAPLPSYDATVMTVTPPATNRAAFTSAVQRFLTTRGARANGLG